MNITNCQPRKDQMLVLVHDTSTLPSGIVVPMDAHKTHRIATVQAVGPEVNSVLGSDGKYHEKPADHRLEPGDMVVMAGYDMGIKLKIEGKEYVLMPHSGAHAILTAK